MTQTGAIRNFTINSENTMNFNAAAATMGFLSKTLKPRYQTFISDNRKRQDLIDRFCTLAIEANGRGLFPWPRGLAKSARALKDSILNNRLRYGDAYTSNCFVYDSEIVRDHISTYDVFTLVVAALLDDEIYLPLYNNLASEADETRLKDDRLSRVATMINSLYNVHFGAGLRCNQGQRMLFVGNLSGVYPKNPNATDDDDRYWFFVEEISSAVSALTKHLIEKSFPESAAPDCIPISLQQNQTCAFTVRDYISLLAYQQNGKFDQTHPMPDCIKKLLTSLKDGVRSWANEHYLPFEDMRDQQGNRYRGVSRYMELDAGLVIPTIMRQAERVPLFAVLSDISDHALELNVAAWIKENIESSDAIDLALSWADSLFDKPASDILGSHQETDERGAALSWMGWPQTLSEEQTSARITLLSNFNQLLSLDSTIGCLHKLQTSGHLGDNFSNLSQIDFSNFTKELNAAFEKVKSIDDFWNIDLGPSMEQLHALEEKFRTIDPTSLLQLAACLPAQDPLRSAAIDGFRSVLKLKTSASNGETAQNSEQGVFNFVERYLVSRSPLERILNEAIKFKERPAVKFLLSSIAAPKAGLLKSPASLDVGLIVDILTKELQNQGSCLLEERFRRDLIQTLIEATAQLPQDYHNRFSKIFIALLTTPDNSGQNLEERYQNFDKLLTACDHDLTLAALIETTHTDVGHARDILLSFSKQQGFNCNEFIVKLTNVILADENVHTAYPILATALSINEPNQGSLEVTFNLLREHECDDLTTLDILIQVAISAGSDKDREATYSALAFVLKSAFEQNPNNINSFLDYFVDANAYDVLAGTLAQMHQKYQESAPKLFDQIAMLSSPEPLANTLIQVELQYLSKNENQNGAESSESTENKPELIKYLLDLEQTKLDRDDTLIGALLDFMDKTDPNNSKLIKSVHAALGDVLVRIQRSRPHWLPEVCADILARVSKEQPKQLSSVLNTLACLDSDHDILVNSLMRAKEKYHISMDSFWVHAWKRGSKIWCGKLAKKLNEKIKTEEHDHHFSDMLASLLVHDAYADHANQHKSFWYQRKPNSKDGVRSFSYANEDRIMKINLGNLESAPLKSALARVIELYPEQLQTVLGCFSKVMGLSKQPIIDALKALLEEKPDYSQRVRSAINSIKPRDRDSVLEQLGLEKPSVAESIKELFTSRPTPTC